MTIVLTLVAPLSANPIGEMKVDINDILGVQQNYEASIIHLKNGRSFRISGIYKNLNDLFYRKI